MRVHILCKVGNHRLSTSPARAEGQTKCQTNEECTGESGIRSVRAVLCGPRLMLGEENTDLDS